MKLKAFFALCAVIALSSSTRAIAYVDPTYLDVNITNQMRYDAYVDISFAGGSNSPYRIVKAFCVKAGAKHFQHIVDQVEGYYHASFLRVRAEVKLEGCNRPTHKIVWDTYDVRGDGRYSADIFEHSPGKFGLKITKL